MERAEKFHRDTGSTVGEIDYLGESARAQAVKSGDESNGNKGESDWEAMVRQVADDMGPSPLTPKPNGAPLLPSVAEEKKEMPKPSSSHVMSDAMCATASTTEQPNANIKGTGNRPSADSDERRLEDNLSQSFRLNPLPQHEGPKVDVGPILQCHLMSSDEYSKYLKTGPLRSFSFVVWGRYPTFSPFCLINYLAHDIVALSCFELSRCER